MKLAELKADIIQKRGLITPAMVAENKSIDLVVRNAETNDGAYAYACAYACACGVSRRTLACALHACV